MNISTCGVRISGAVRALFAVFIAVVSCDAGAQTNSWISAGSGSWDQGTNWSLGVPPSSSQSVVITNYFWRAVVIDSSTPVDSPGSMTVTNLLLGGAPIGGETTQNTLLLNYVGAGNPLVVGIDTNTPGWLVVGTNSAVAMFSSGLIVNNTLGATTNTWASSRWTALLTKATTRRWWPDSLI